ncbi:MAG: hypothetical protein NVS1B11_05260 [Terriglobales bacterium]
MADIDHLKKLVTLMDILPEMRYCKQRIAGSPEQSEATILWDGTEAKNFLSLFRDVHPPIWQSAPKGFEIP